MKARMNQLMKMHLSRGFSHGLANPRMWLSVIRSTALCSNGAKRRSHFRLAFLDIPFSFR